jgi:ATP-dependent DNA helicase PIF1
MKIFDLLDELGKRLRKSILPFGGIQVIFSGDFYQLPPVGNTDDSSTSKFCFESSLWVNTFPNTIQLKKIFRQTDTQYIKILNEIRIGKLHRSSYNALMTRVGISPVGKHKPTILLPRRQDVDEINITELNAIENEPIEYTFNIADATTFTLTDTERKTASQYSPEDKAMESRYLIKNILCDETIRLKKGAHVMCVANIDPEISGGICNGSQGIISDFINGYPMVHFNNGTKRIIRRHMWKSETIPGVGIEHVPLILSWAITIHKAQGVTLENAYIDVGSGIFEFGQSYVALSRVKSLEGLYLKGFDPQKIKINPKVKQFYGD